jgi:hypothetical protein
MADQFRDQVNTARRAGYTDDQLIGYLKDKDPRITQALDAGYKPVEILEHLAPSLSTGEEAVRKAGVAARGVSEALAPATAGAMAGLMVGGPVGAGVGALAGGLAVPATDVLVQGYNRLTDSNVRLPSQVISSMIPGPRAETPAERVLQTSAGALGGTSGAVSAGRALSKVPNTLVNQTVGRMGSTVAAPAISPQLQAIGAEAARRPIGQIVAAPAAAAVGQTTTEATDNPLLGLAAGVGTSMAAAVRPVKRQQAPDAEELLKRSKANYDILDKSGFQLDTAEFKQHMDALPAKLRKDLGYVEDVNPKVASAFKQLTSNNVKDVAEITALRKVIGSAAKSPDASERMIASKLLDEFDDYVLNAVPTAGDRKAIEAWKAARADYAKVKKSEMLEDIVLRADVSQTGKEASIAQGLSALAKDKKKMRFFLPAEQEAIRDAAKGGTLQTMLRTIGKFTPMTPAAAIFTAVNPFGAYTAAAGMTAKELASVRRVQQMNRLGEQIRLGGVPKIIEGPFANEPVFFSRGVQNMLAPESQNALAP